MNNRGGLGTARWWPLWLLWIAGALLIVGGWLFDSDASRQAGVMRTLGIAAACMTLSFVWLAAFSRLPWKTRLGTAGALFLVFGALALSFRFEGVSGDLIPIFKWRWSGVRAVEQSEIEPTRVETGGEFPQFLGPRRDATIAGVDLIKDWDNHPPRRLWRIPIGPAWSGFAISGIYAVTQEQSEGSELISCYHLLTGKRLWENAAETRYDNPLGGVGPRATPSIDGDRVYAVGATGVVSCLSLQTGTLIWRFNMLEKHGARLPEWGVAGSPLILGDLLILNPGGRDGDSLVAYDKQTGDVVWKGGNDEVHWSSPVVHELHGETQILVFNKDGVAAHDVGNGSVLWTYPWKRSPGTPRVAIPTRVSDNGFVISSGYGAGAEMFRVSRVGGSFEAQQVWRSLHLKSKFNNFVFKDGYLYGLDDGMMTCIDVESGRRTWKKGRLGHGQFLLGRDWLLLQAENGEIVLFDPAPDESRVLGTFKALDGKSWNPPAMAGPFLLARNHLEAACYELAVTGSK